jgi:hypothetical protein
MAYLHKIDFGIIEKQTLKNYGKSLGIFEDLLIFFSSSLFCLRNYYKLKIPAFFFGAEILKGYLFFLNNGEVVILKFKGSLPMEQGFRLKK